MYTPVNIIHNANCQPHPWHPSVVYQKNGFCGHPFWMALTPFPPLNVAPYRDRYELPCIHYSDDGLKWFPIDANPLDDLTPSDIEAHNYFSDPHLIYKAEQLECFYRYTILKNRQLEGNQTMLYKRISKDGIRWSERQLIADLRKEKDIKIWGSQIISPAFIWLGQQYRCWYVDRSSYQEGRLVRCTESNDGIEWTASKECTLTGCKIDPWHIDVQYYKDAFWMLVYGFDQELLAMFRSSDGFDWQYISDVIRPSHKQGDFWSNEIYRSCSVNCGNHVRVYFSAHNGRRSAIGLLKTTDMINYDFVSGQYAISYRIKTLDDIRFIRRIKNLCKRILK